MQNVLGVLGGVLMGAALVYGQGTSLAAVDTAKSVAASPAPVSALSVAKDSAAPSVSLASVPVAVAPAVVSSPKVESAGTAVAAEPVFGDTVDAIRYQAKLLRKKAADMIAMGDQVTQEVAKLDKAIDRLDDAADNCKDKADDLSDKAEEMDNMILERQTALSPSVSDSAKEVSDKLMCRADALIHRMKSAKVLKKERRELAEKLYDRADEILDDAKDLEKCAAKIVESRDPRPYALRKTFTAGGGFSLTIVDPDSDKKLHLLMKNGFFIAARSGHFQAGVEDLGFYLVPTIRGNRYAGVVAPFASLSYFAGKRTEHQLGAGVRLQGQDGRHTESSSAVTPYIKASTAYWAGERFAFGPVFRLNYVAKGDEFTTGINGSSVLPEGALYSEFGLRFMGAF